MTRSESELRATAEAAGQGHLFAFWDELDEAGRGGLLAQIDGVEFETVARLQGLLQKGSSESSGGALEPPELFPLERDGAEEKAAQDASGAGTELLSEGRVGYVLVAGGQGSRLGLDGPKGAFPVGPVSGRTLFEIHARRLAAAAKRHGKAMPWYVMTSRQNDEATRTFFEQHGFFGLDRGDVFFFSQDMLPALSDDGKILLAGKDQLFLAPNGHGGVLEALATSGALDDMRKRGVDLISYFQVDNPLVRPADPLFLGLHRSSGASMSSKAVEKVDPDEKVGVLGRIDGAMGIIEYSDLSDELRTARDDSGRLAFRAGNIAVHAIDVDFVGELTEGGLQLPMHLARKRMKVVGEDGAVAENWGTKFEAFVFDALSRSKESVTLEVSRSLEFSPVKNKEGSDSPSTARADLCRMFAGWASAAGLELPAADAEGVVPVEVDPLLAEDESSFVAAAPTQPSAIDGGHLYDA